MIYCDLFCRLLMGETDISFHYMIRLGINDCIFFCVDDTCWPTICMIFVVHKFSYSIHFSKHPTSNKVKTHICIVVIIVNLRLVWYIVLSLSYDYTGEWWLIFLPKGLDRLYYFAIFVIYIKSIKFLSVGWIVIKLI